MCDSMRPHRAISIPMETSSQMPFIEDASSSMVHSCQAIVFDDTSVVLGRPWSSLVVGDECCISQSGKLLCLCQTPKNMHHMNATIPYMFDCWADPVVYLLLLKSSMTRYKSTTSRCVLTHRYWYKLGQNFDCNILGHFMVAAIAQWIRLRLRRPGIEF